jgi:hypothetical protein
MDHDYITEFNIIAYFDEQVTRATRLCNNNVRHMWLTWGQHLEGERWQVWGRHALGSLYTTATTHMQWQFHNE